MNVNRSAGGAKSYFAEADYYSEGQELQGVWGGRGAARLGLSGIVEKGAWEALCDNRDPATGQTLTARQKTERRVGYDINFHVPKSVSLLYGLTNDARVLDAFDGAVVTTMAEMEQEMKTRVRRGGKDEDRKTGEMLWAKYVHLSSRPVGGIPDPHVHAHVFCFNSTYDAVEKRWKAGQFADLKRDAPYFQARFHGHLADRLTKVGLPVHRSRTGYEIDGVAASTLAKFSRRTELIDALAKEKKITSAKEKAELGARTREKKQKKLSMPELRRVWMSRLDANEQSQLLEVAGRLGGLPLSKDPEHARQVAREAVLHCFERNAVIPERTLLAEAIRRGTGRATPDAVEAAMAEQNLIVGEKDGRHYATTAVVLSEEQRMLDFARLGRGRCRPLCSQPHAFARDWLNQDQRQAVQHVLSSTDAVILIRGVAGTGKTALMQEAVEGIQADGHQVFTFAPSAEASRGVLREAGFAGAETVARLLLDSRLQEQVRHQVIWIDEASLLSSRVMGEVFDLAERLEARVVLCGDHRQTGSVERGAALRLLQSESGLLPAEVKEIQRQLLDSIDTATLIGKRDRALIATMVYSFARVSAVVNMNAQDYWQNGKRWWLRLHEKGGKEHEVPAHHNTETYLDEYIQAAGISGERKSPLFRTADGRTDRLTPLRMDRRDVWHMIRRRAVTADLPARTCCHTFRATGITAYLENGGTIENAQLIAAHESPRTTKLYDRTSDEITLDEIERIRI